MHRIPAFIRFASCRHLWRLAAAWQLHVTTSPSYLRPVHAVLQALGKQRSPVVAAVFSSPNWRQYFYFILAANKRDSKNCFVHFVNPLSPPPPPSHRRSCPLLRIHLFHGFPDALALVIFAPLVQLRICHLSRDPPHPPHPPPPPPYPPISPEPTALNVDRKHGQETRKVVPPTMAAPITPEDQARLLEDALIAVRQQTVLMRKCLDTPGKLMDALKCWWVDNLCSR